MKNIGKELKEASKGDELDRFGKDLKKMADDYGFTDLGGELKTIGKGYVDSVKEVSAELKKEYQNERREWKDDPKKKRAELAKEQRTLLGKKRIKLVADGIEIGSLKDWKIYDDDDNLIYYASKFSDEYSGNGFSIKDLNHKTIVDEDIQGILQNKHYLKMYGEDIGLIQKRGSGYSVKDGEWTVAGMTIKHHGKTVGTISKIPSVGNTTTYVTYNQDEDPLWILTMTILKKIAKTKLL